MCVDIDKLKVSGRALHISLFALYCLADYWHCICDFGEGKNTLPCVIYVPVKLQNPISAVLIIRQAEDYSVGCEARTAAWGVLKHIYP